LKIASNLKKIIEQFLLIEF